MSRVHEPSAGSMLEDLRGLVEATISEPYAERYGREDPEAPEAKFLAILDDYVAARVDDALAARSPGPTPSG